MFFQPPQLFLQFVVENPYYQFVALPFSLSMGPQCVKTKILASVLQLLRYQDWGYLNDMILKERWTQKLMSNVQQKVQVLKRYSWMVRPSEADFGSDATYGEL